MEVELETFTATLSFTKVGEIVPILKKRLSQRGEILQDTRTNTMIISEIPENITLLKKIIDTLDVANPQVSIEARIVETDTTYAKSLGIQWGYGFTADSMYGNQTSLRFPNSISILGNTLGEGEGPLEGYAVNLPASAPSSKTVFSLANVTNTFRLDVALSAMEDRGKGRIISSPKTTTQNNVEARLMQGVQIPVQTLQNNTISVRYVPAALELNVTPQITAGGDIICRISIRNNYADWANEITNVGVPIVTQSWDTTVMVGDGGTIVIGGLYKIEDSEARSATPFFSKIPLLGNLFKNKTNRRTQKETLVFITPRIIR
jgi:type IV pilus assembly protein PilQ